MTNEYFSQERQDLEEAAKSFHDYLTREWILQGKPEVIQTDGGPVNFKEAHGKVWQDLADLVQARGLETDAEKALRESGPGPVIEI